MPSTTAETLFVGHSSSLDPENYWSHSPRLHNIAVPVHIIRRSAPSAIPRIPWHSTEPSLVLKS
jgi:hypothetical protein